MQKTLSPLHRTHSHQYFIEIFSPLKACRRPEYNIALMPHLLLALMPHLLLKNQISLAYVTVEVTVTLAHLVQLIVTHDMPFLYAMQNQRGVLKHSFNSQFSFNLIRSAC